MFNVQWEEPSSRPAISPTFNLRMPGRNSVLCSLKIRIWSLSPASTAASSCQRKSIKFTKRSDSLERPISVPLDFPDFGQGKLRLSSVQTPTFHTGNSWIP